MNITPITEPNVLIKNTNPAPESFLLDVVRIRAIKIGFKDDKRTSGNAKRIKLPIKLPINKSIPDILGSNIG